MTWTTDGVQSKPTVWSAYDVRRLRYRLGWSRAELARILGCESGVVGSWESGEANPAEDISQRLIAILNQCESNSERVQRRPVAEVLMNDRGLAQIHELDVIEKFEEGSVVRSRMTQSKIL